jgi:hypothetical protein
MNPTKTAMSNNYELQNLPDADFRYQNLQNAKFRWAYLHRADFTGANLRGADFSDADLREADFTGADVTGATFDRAIIDGTTFDEVFPVENVPMRRFIVTLTRTIEEEIEVEATGKEQAKEEAISLYSSQWEVEDVREVA